jgi:hypothetical protein
MEIISFVVLVQIVDGVIIQTIVVFMRSISRRELRVRRGIRKGKVVGCRREDCIERRLVRRERRRRERLTKRELVTMMRRRKG